MTHLTDKGVVYSPRGGVLTPAYSTPKECLEALEKVRAYCQLHDFQNSVHYSLWMIENDCVKATYHQSNIQKHITDFFK